ncbi:MULTISPECIES: AfsR/SARP family transcriptional regulator [unclassified Streptomyces]|uniref:AfsR/SARP family transcriptional regulator n=1 Tax=unclassified Streptomyces TaxID=2593676 RepID=UPI0016553D35|nr:AfsR/SARP family transcriptional regulator [Streptomyces sp. CB02980]MCB8901557.1 winged helix-turn-helix domain-containing protein [Streptomyces sp. CB02980]
MRFQLLGPLSVTDGRDLVMLPPSKPTALLAALLIRPGSIVSADRLRDIVWGEEHPTTAKTALQSCVLRLRRLFAKYGIEHQAVVAVAGGYRIDADAETLDLLHFRRLVEQAAASGNDSELYTLRSALALWQGGLLSNVPSDLLHRDEVPRLTEERLRVLERVCDIELEDGRCREALVDLWEVTRVYPAHERFAEQLIEALYRTGRQTEALAEYRRIKGHLRERLGVDPRAELQGLELAILRGEDLGRVEVARRRAALAGHATERTAAPGVQDPQDSPASAGRDALAAPHPLPLPLPPIPSVPGFTGREHEVHSLVSQLTTERPGGDSERAPFAVLSGAPGIGKTALALHVAHLVSRHFPDGCLLVPLTRPDGSPRPAEEAADELRRALPAGPGTGRGRSLLVLDDVVHPDQVRPLLTAYACGAAIVTSRMGLAALVATHGGTVHRLGALDPEQSQALLTAVLGRERIAAEPTAALPLATACGHHPLALRIAAARLLTRPRLRLADYADWLRHDPVGRLSLADDPRMSVPQRLDEALKRLPPVLAEAHLRLAASPHDPLTTSGAAGLLGLPEDTAEQVIERLLDAGLLEEGQPGAFWTHDLLRAHARRAAGSSVDHAPALLRPPRHGEFPQLDGTRPAALR